MNAAWRARARGVAVCVAREHCGVVSRSDRQTCAFQPAGTGACSIVNTELATKQLQTKATTTWTDAGQAHALLRSYCYKHSLTSCYSSPELKTGRYKPPP